MRASADPAGSARYSRMEDAVADHDYGFLLRIAADMLRCFNARTQTPGSFANDFFAGGRSSGGVGGKGTRPRLMEQDEIDFAKEVFYGVVRYRGMLSALVRAFRHALPAVGSEKSDSLMYRVIGYLILYRSEELGIPRLQKFVAAASECSHSVKSLVRLLLCEGDMRQYVTPEWLKVVDSTAVDGILTSLQRIASTQIGVRMSSEGMSPSDFRPPSSAEPLPPVAGPPHESPTLAAIPEPTPEVAEELPATEIADEGATADTDVPDEKVAGTPTAGGEVDSSQTVEGAVNVESVPEVSPTGQNVEEDGEEEDGQTMHQIRQIALAAGGSEFESPLSSPRCHDVEVGHRADPSFDAIDQRPTQQPNVTQVKPFNLTRPKPRLLPPPEPCSCKPLKAKPPPSFKAVTLEKLQAKALERKHHKKEETVKKFASAGQRLMTLERPSNLEKIRKEVEDHRNSHLTFQPAPMNPVYVPSVPAEVRLNAASILRADALHAKKQEEEYQLLKAFEVELHDSSEFYKWKEVNEEKEELERIERVERRKASIQMAREQAMLARARQVDLNLRNAQELKDGQNFRQEKLQQKLKEEIEVKFVNARDIKQGRAMQLLVRDELVGQKQSDAAAQKEQRRTALAEKEREEAAEREARRDRIKGIEQNTTCKVTPFDPTEAPTTGFLEEMSFAELQQRKEAVRVEETEKVNSLRQQIQQRKEKKNSELLEKAEGLARIRTMAAEEARERTARETEKKEKTLRLQKDLREKAIVEAHARVVTKRMQQEQGRRKLAEELKEIALKRQFLSADREAVREKAHEQVVKGACRTAAARQHQALKDHEKSCQIMRNEEDIRSAHATHTLQARLALRGSAEAQENSKKGMQQTFESLAKTKRQAVLVQIEEEKRGTHRLSNTRFGLKHSNTLQQHQ